MKLRCQLLKIYKAEGSQMKYGYVGLLESYWQGKTEEMCE